MRLLAVLLLVVAATCTSGKRLDGPTQSIAGNYVLQSVNDDALPAVIEDAQDTVIVTSGSITISALGTFIFSETADSVRSSLNGTVTANGDGGWTFDPNEPPGTPTQPNGTGQISVTTLLLLIPESGAQPSVRVYSKIE